MEAGLQHIFLIMKKTLSTAIILTIPLASEHLQAENTVVSNASALRVLDQRVDRDFFELGFYAGVLNIQDFSSDALIGLRGTVYATEDFFLHFDIASADASESRFEEAQGELVDDKDRRYDYYDLLVGYNIYSGEVFPQAASATLSNLYLVAGVGNTAFGGEENFTYILGAGFKVEVLTDWYWSVDLRNHFYKSDLIKEDEAAHNVEFSSGISYLF